MSLYHGKTILAPMVRICNLGFRVFCDAQGADVVFSEEIVAAKLVRCRREVRVYDESVGPVVEFVAYEPFKKGWKRSVVFSTRQRCPNSNSNSSSSTSAAVVLQLGVSSPAVGAEAACLLGGDVDGIDVNMGCPKKFSVENGMGAALMGDAGRAAAILIAVDAAVNAEERVAARGGRRVALSFKTRLRETAEETAEMLINIMERVGPNRIHAITLHARTVDQSSDTEPHYDRAATTVKLLRRHPLMKDMCFVLNGSIMSRADGADKMVQFGFDAVMIARHAMWDMTVFSLKSHQQNSCIPYDDALKTPFASASWMDLYRELIRYHVKYRTPFGFVKYHLTRSIPCIPPLKHLMKEVQQNANCYEDLAKIFDIPVEEQEIFRSVSGVELVSSIPEEVFNSLGVSSTTVDSNVANDVLVQDKDNSAAQTIKKARTELQ